jgi:hypothetical protein
MIRNKSSNCHKRINDALMAKARKLSSNPKEAYPFVNVFDGKHDYLLVYKT